MDFGKRKQNQFLNVLFYLFFFFLSCFKLLDCIIIRINMRFLFGNTLTAWFSQRIDDRVR